MSMRFYEIVVLLFVPVKVLSQTGAGVMHAPRTQVPRSWLAKVCMRPDNVQINADTQEHQVHKRIVACGNNMSVHEIEITDSSQVQNAVVMRGLLPHPHSTAR